MLYCVTMWPSTKDAYTVASQLNTMPEVGNAYAVTDHTVHVTVRVDDFSQINDVLLRVDKACNAVAYPEHAFRWLDSDSPRKQDSHNYAFRALMRTKDVVFSIASGIRAIPRLFISAVDSYLEPY